MKYAVLADGSAYYVGDDVGKVDGLEYMSDEDAAEFLRGIGDFAVYDNDGAVICLFGGEPTAKEAAKMDDQVVAAGKGKGKKLGQIKKEKKEKKK